MSSKEEILQRIRDAIVQLDIDGIRRVAQEALEAGIPAYQAITEGMNKGMQIVGNKFQEGEFFLSDLVISAETMKAGMEILNPYLKIEQVKYLGTVVIATVKGDIHDIGKILVSTLLSAGGFEVHDLGIDVDAERFVKETEKVKPHIIAMSALLSTTMTYMSEVIRALNAAGLRDKVKTIVGGAPLNQDFAQQIGADAYGKDAVEAVEVCSNLVGRSR
jgi:5-methyltetrahydrofolate--homocysteine methyltransferase